MTWKYLRGKDFFFLEINFIHNFWRLIPKEVVMAGKYLGCGNRFFLEINFTLSYITQLLEIVAQKNGDIQIKNCMWPLAQFPTYNVAPRGIQVYTPDLRYSEDEQINTLHIHYICCTPKVYLLRCTKFLCALG